MAMLRVFVTAILLSVSPALLGAGLFTQIVLPFDSAREYSYHYDKAEHALVLSFAKTSPSEFESLDRYDERLIRRVLMKDLGPSGTEVTLVLRDRDVRAHVGHFDEPFRVTIDLFDAHFEEERDPETGMPLASPSTTKQGASETIPAADGLVAPQQSPFVETEYKAPKHKLLEPTPKLMTQPEELTRALEKADAGIGKAWRDYPPYVYRIQTALFEGESAQSWSKEAKTKALSSARAMADYAAKLFDFGHESRALVAYQQVLHRDPSIFDKDALHLWRFAEVHLGQGNLTLARGYYQALVEKHPSSPLARFAKMRILDVQAIRLIKQDRYADTPDLAKSLAEIKPQATGELSAQLAIRKAFWSKAGLAKSYDRNHIPALTPESYNELAMAYPTSESRRTRFVAGTLLLSHMVDPKTPWTRATGPFADAYFKEFKDRAAEPFRSDLRRKLDDKLNASLRKLVADGELVRAIDDYEALPASLKNVDDNAQTAWALGEAYRKLGQTAKAVDFYRTAAAKAPDGPDRFRANFWLAVTAGALAAELRAAGKASAADRMNQTALEADRRMGSDWDKLRPEERKVISTAYKDPFERAVKSPARLRTPPKIVLANWTDALSTRVSADAGGDPTDWDRNFSPSGSAVVLLSDLARRFSELGMTNERRQAMGLLRHMKPADFADDAEAKKLWTKELIDLAEDYRKASEYLEAGRLYSLVGAESENWEGRAEALYKGGLLLYRAGRREEAIAAFKRSAEDGNNIFYANLAKERLAQLE